MQVYKQIEGLHYDGSSNHALVTNARTFQIILIRMLMANWIRWIVDVKGTFLHGEFEDGKVTCMIVPRGFEKLFPNNVVLKLKKFIYGLKQAAIAFWLQLLIPMKRMKMIRRTADPCLVSQVG